MRQVGRIVLGVMVTLFFAGLSQAEGPKGEAWQAWEHRKREAQDRVCGVPEKILANQRLARVTAPSLEEAVATALEAADKEADALIDRRYHTGKRLLVPDAFATIQQAVDAAQPRDVVVVRPGTYYELITMKDGVKLVSDASDGGDELVAVEGAWLKLPRRALRTIIDGSKSQAANLGVVDFNEDAGRHTIVDGFTVQNLPEQDHHIPGHAHAVNARGASAVIMHCLVRNNGTTGIGSHVVFSDQDRRMPERDFRWANVRHKAEGVVYRNIVRGNLGLGIGCNHFSTPFVLGNEVLENEDVELEGDPSPGIGVKHGAAPTVVGNIVHDNLGGGILSKVGDPQGVHPIDRPTHPTIAKNVVVKNGTERPGVSARGAGSEETPVRILGNFIYDAGAVGIALSQGAVAVVEENVIAGGGAPGIEISASVALALNRNEVTGAQGPGFLIMNGARVLKMADNVADGNKGPRFMLRDAVIVE